MQKDTIAKIVKWLKSELKLSKCKGFVLGLSGGLDSVVCAALTRKATSNSLGLILPIESDIQDLDDAARVAGLLGLGTEYIDLTGVYNHIVKLLPKGSRVALGNIKARLRMIMIYYYANLNNYLVCGTGNKTEISLGYFTKYGDGGCDILPIGDLYKFEVRKLAKALGIPKKIVDKVPTAGLWRGQTDESEIGFSYKDIDRTLQEIEKGIVRGKIGRRLVRMNKHSEHKRQMPKICYVKSQNPRSKSFTPLDSEHLTGQANSK